LSEKHLTLFLTSRGRRHQQAALEAAPPELEVIIVYRPARQDLSSWLPRAEFFMSERSGVIDAEMIQAAERLRLIQRLGSLVYDIDLEAARAAGVPVCAVPIRGSILVAEHMIMQMLALAKRLPEAYAAATGNHNVANEGAWPESRRTNEDTFAYNWAHIQAIGSLLGKTVGILGLGEIGVELARRLRGFLLGSILYYKRVRLPEHVEADVGLTYAEPDILFAASDFLCILLPYSVEADMSIDANVLARMKPTACVVSCGSGSVIDEAALADAIRAGGLAGAALDTYEWEPIRPDNPLLPLARDPRCNVLLTPHTAASSGRAWPGKARAADYDNLLRVLRGEPLLHRIV
jgi:lactate dehydrogenase-like 2-hydroxyacid dehydrogenase